ncbi:aconitate hydratase [Alkalispirochaeta odontotermitis]|nr:aconitate hydratase [Alkalispirochaeta odontotermitis]CAB1076658.1 Aconitate hydratase (EC [Olavius algarvensis Delta 1 endosymbiont]
MENTDFISHVNVQGREYQIFDINKLEEKGIAPVRKLPYSIKILVENLLRKLDGRVVKEADLLNIAKWQKRYDAPLEIPYHPARVLMQDFTGVPAVVDLAAMRDAVKDLGGDPAKINPLVPVDLVVDHSVQVDFFGTPDALTKNVAKEYERNSERYALLKWAQKSFDNFSVVPPNSGICHQVNLEYLGQIVIAENNGSRLTAYPDTLVGTDSHTTMINGIGVMGWGVGGIEAEAVMLGQPYYMSIPEVIGVRLVGELQEGVTATDLVLKATEMLRTHGVVEKFVEYFGPAMKQLTVPDRATLSNMTPEYGATMGFFPVDEKTIDYFKMTNREMQAEVVENCAKALGLFYTGEEDPAYSEVLELDLTQVAPAVAGPARPQDRINLPDLKDNFATVLGCDYERDTDVAHISQYHDESGSRTTREEDCAPKKKVCEIVYNGQQVKLCDGSIVIAAITSCTNTSNPFVLLGAGLVAKKAVEKGLQVPVYVKTSLAPGSKVVIDYLKDAGLASYLETLGFNLAAFGCTTCIGNSGPLPTAIDEAVANNDLTVAAVLSGNRNFEARIHQRVKANFLASPMLVVAFALAGRIDIDLTSEPLGTGSDGRPVFLKDIWPGSSEIDQLAAAHVKKQFYQNEYAKIFEGDDFWRGLEVTESTTFDWDEKSTYIKKPPYFEGFKLQLDRAENISDARALLVLGDSVTTDHISPAGAIPQQYPAGKYLIDQGVAHQDFNSYGSRRGNHEVMMRGTFGNIRIKNQMMGQKEGSYTLRYPAGKEMFVYDAAMDYLAASVPLVVLGGKEYGTGSSRDWAAKGTNLLGIKAVITESYERIHRSNLVGMGALPLVFKEGQSWSSLGLDGSETYSISGVEDMQPRKVLQVKAGKADGRQIEFEVIARLDTEVDVAYFENNGILPYVLRKVMGES